MSGEERAPVVYLIDASIYIFQAHFSPYVECFDTEGEDLSAVYGFSQFLLQFLGRTSATHVAVAHDESLFCGFRHDLCPDYKSNRELPDDNLAMQLRACQEICAELGLASYSSKQFEADDIIGTMSNRCRSGLIDQQNPVIEIVSRDKDLAQLLIGQEDRLWDYQGNRCRNRKDIYSELGIHPEQLPDYLGLIGDAVDCISGVPGVGPVKARELLQRFESIEGIYENLDEVKNLPLRGARGLQQKLADHREEAELSKLLATIVCDVDDPKEKFGSCGLDHVERASPSSVDLADFLARYRFDDRARHRITTLAQRLT
ncbi:MAG: flap endonuclease [Kangiella sp.]|nr:flap endonuclease [Kangiella sp.]